MKYEVNIAHSSFTLSSPQFTRDKSHISEIPADEHEILKQRKMLKQVKTQLELLNAGNV